MIQSIKKLYNRTKHLFRNFDCFQLMAIPVLLVLLYFSVDLKNNKIDIGVILPTTGNYSTKTISHLNGIKLAASHINKHGGIDGKKIALHIKDSNSNEVVELARDLIYKEKVSAILGGLTARSARKIQYLSEKALVPYIMGMCTHFETANTSDYTFRTITDDQHQFEALSSISANRFESKHPAIIYDSELYGLESAQKYSSICLKHYQKATTLISYPKGTVNFKTELEEVFKSYPDSLVVLAPAAEAALIVRQAREMRFKKPILGANPCATNEFLQLAGIYSEGLITTLPYNPRAGGQLSDGFIAAYLEEYGYPADADAATGYETMMVLKTALEKASQSDETSLRDALASLHGWESIVGSGGFDRYGNQLRPAEIAIIKGKQAIPISLEGLF